MLSYFLFYSVVSHQWQLFLLIFGVWTVVKGGNELYTGKDNYLHGFRYFSYMCCDSRLFCMFTHTCKLTKRSTSQSTCQFCNWPKNYYFVKKISLEVYVFTFENKKLKSKQTYYVEVNFAYDRTFDFSKQTSSAKTFWRLLGKSTKCQFYI